MANTTTNTLEIRTATSCFVFDADCENMFKGETSWSKNNIGEKITSIDFGGFINTSNVTTMINMFSYCYELQSISISNLNTSNVTKMEYMFYNCQKLESLDLSTFNTSNVTNMHGMFAYCKTLQTLNLSSFNTSKVEDMSYMFQECRTVTSLDLSSFNTGNVTTMKEMFLYCQSLESITFGENFKTSNVTDMGSMFQGCYKVTSLDLTRFEFTKNPSVNNMFYSVGYNSGTSENPIHIKVTSDGYNFLSGKYIGIGEYASLVDSYGNPWNQ